MAAGAAASAGSQGWELIAALYHGLGMPPPSPDHMSPQHLQLLGQLLRALVAGTLELLAARTIAKRELGAGATQMMARENNPLKFSPTPEAALRHLLGPPERGFITPLAAVDDAFGDLRAHQIAVLAGMRAALDEVLARFNPEALELRLAPGALWDKLVPGSRKAKLWESFSENYSEIMREIEGDFDTLFGQAFNKAYQAQLAELLRSSKAEPSKPR
jgi:type VI secretion system FHA domain protein